MSRFVSAGTSDAGNVRGNNEDRVYIDDERGIFLVVDGMGGQAAGEEAAEIAVKTVRGRLERPTEAAEQRVREAIALANNAIYEAASGNPEWRGMACVLTLALVEDGHAIVGHVGDSRAYQIRAGKIEKITRDHSPVGEREDAGELSEEEAMRHPRRNEVYRDVGSSPRTPDDADFIDVQKIRVPEDSALLLCSDGLSDVVPARRILQAVEDNANDCEAAVRILVRAAVAEGKDNVSVILVEGEKFSDSVKKPVAVPVSAITKPPVAPDDAPSPGPLGGRAAFFVYGLVLASTGWAAWHFLQHSKPAPAVHLARIIHVAPVAGEYASVPEAINIAASGDTVELEPGTYPEKVLLKNGVTIRSSRSHEAIIAGGIVADAVQSAVLQDVVVGDAGIELNSSDVRIDGIESSGEIRYSGTSAGSLRGSKIASSIAIDGSSSPEISVNFIRGDVRFNSSGSLKLDANAIDGVLFFAAAPPAPVATDLLKRNLLSSGKKAIQIVKQGGRSEPK